ncbi:MAG TPA: hypothetical protein VFJ58_14710 [Armatimonadota bacterium]|nr:hypothetical protein [Armatimonadota bacterium]
MTGYGRAVLLITVVAACVCANGTACTAASRVVQLQRVEPPGASPQAQGTPRTDPEAQSWIAALQTFCKAQGVVLFYDVDPSSQDIPFVDTNSFHGAAAMRALALMGGREWTDVKGLQIFARPVRPRPEQNTRAFDQFAVGWLKNLPPDQMSALVEGKTRFSDIDPEMQSRLLALAAHSIPGVALAMLSHPDEVPMRLQFQPMIVWSDPKTGSKHSRLLSVQEDPLQLTAPAAAPDDSQPAQPAAPPNLGRPARGPLDFGAGTLLTLDEIMARASKAFGVNYSYDHRLGQSWYFVNGKLDQDTFERAIALLTTVSPAKRAPTYQTHFPAEIPDLLNGPCSQLLGAKLQLADGSSWGATPAQFAEGSTMTAAALAGGNPELLAELQKDGLGLDTTVALSPAMTLLTQPGGASPRFVPGQPPVLYVNRLNWLIPSN